LRTLADQSLPPALVEPELIKVSAIPTRKIYDFTKHSVNNKYLEEGALEQIIYEEHQDNRIKEEDLKKIEIELKRK
jgi:hypothetical protein